MKTRLVALTALIVAVIMLTTSVGVMAVPVTPGPIQPGPVNPNPGFVVLPVQTSVRGNWFFNVDTAKYWGRYYPVIYRGKPENLWGFSVYANGRMLRQLPRGSTITVTIDGKQVGTVMYLPPGASESVAFTMTARQTRDLSPGLHTIEVTFKPGPSWMQPVGQRVNYSPSQLETKILVK